MEGFARPLDMLEAHRAGQDAPRCRHRGDKTHHHRAPPAPPANKHAEAEYAKKLMTKAVARARDDKVRARDAALSLAPSRNAEVEVHEDPLLPPVSLHMASLVSLDARAPRISQVVCARQRVTRPAVLRTLLLCLQRLGTMPRDLRRYVCSWVAAERVVLLGGVLLVSDSVNTPPRYAPHARYGYHRELSTWVGATRVVSVDPRAPANVIELPPLPEPLFKVRATLNAATGELWAIGFPLLHPSMAALGHERRPDAAKQNPAVCFALDAQRTAWRTVALPLVVTAAASVAAWAQWLVLCNAQGSGRDALVCLASRKPLTWLPVRHDHERLERVRPLVIGCLLFALCSAKSCERRYEVGECSCCCYGTRRRSDLCCSSLQVLDLEDVAGGWLALPSPGNVHLADRSLQKCLFVQRGSDLVFWSGESPVLYRLPLADLRDGGDVHWQEEPVSGPALVRDASMDRWDVRGRRRLLGHALDLSQRDAASIETRCQVDEEQHGYSPSHVFHNALYINGCECGVLQNEPDDSTLWILYATVVCPF